ncbi:PREDICTED: uncharacterized protein LOC104604181 [Nelumbo nucifera]|uniref:Uncharacterized protein LOC104604181 n=2 Tax=Nelumbo nucifera TaxID=4432 RepID=A0A1U8AL60_NELNU|nr:PREDICTED: uncharacterized protein LOC104604181 [Nelumbo nucifera]XP_019054436.1 PREDICTED: uncharacterized protein LOC104604181 [Nelumbo nucifera]DAD29168.1 TPA_asm: hypothetical protein HUJ06_030636 [Nelumbo nucifera]
MAFTPLFCLSSNRFPLLVFRVPAALMSFPLRISGRQIPASHRECLKMSRVFTRFYFLHPRSASKKQYIPQRLCSTTGNGDTYDILEDGHRGSSSDHEGMKEKSTSQKAKTFTSNETLKKLRRYGIAGILSYGLLNTVYYLTTFLSVWLFVLPSSGKMGYVAAVERFLKIMAMVWAGSQVTKVVRAGGALALAPFVDKGLSWFTVTFKFESQGKAFMAIVSLCFILALLLFFVVTLLWA